MRFVIAAALATALLCATAQAEVASSSPGAFLIRTEAEVAASPDDAWRALTRPNHWWNSAHTYSGDARRISLDLRAGGCWCERWDGQSVEHGRVLAVTENDGIRTLRLLAPLGPLQEMGVSAVLTYNVAPHPDGAKVTMTYRVAGDPGLSLDAVAPPVDQVLMEQFGRFIRYTASGTPD